MSYQEVSRPEAKAQRRHRKFTPERIQQIKIWWRVVKLVNRLLQPLG